MSPQQAASGASMSEERPFSLQLFLGRLLTRLLPSAAGPRAVVDPDDIESSVKRRHWYISVPLFAVVWCTSLLLVRFWPPARTSVITLAVDIADNWMNQKLAAIIFFEIGLMYVVIGILGNPFAGMWRARHVATGEQPTGRPSLKAARHLPGVVGEIAKTFAKAFLVILIGVVGAPYWLVRYWRRLPEVSRLLNRVFSPFQTEVKGRLRRFGLQEEQIFREGSELWAYRQTGDRRLALLESTALHYTYNRVALGFSFYILAPVMLVGGAIFLIVR